MIETRNLTKTFDDFTAVDSLNLTIETENFLVSSVQTAQEKQRRSVFYPPCSFPQKGRS